MPLRPAAFPCCREHDLFAPVAGYGQAIRRDLADEVYWFRWDSTNDGCAAIRIARLGREAMAFRTYRPSHYGKVRRFHGPVSRGAGCNWKTLSSRRTSGCSTNMAGVTVSTVRLGASR